MTGYELGSLVTFMKFSTTRSPSKANRRHHADEEEVLSLKEYVVNELLDLRQPRIKNYIVSRTAILDLILNP